MKSSNKSPAIGIDFGTAYTCMAVFQHGKIDIITNDHANRLTPSYVSFTDTQCLVGETAKNQAAGNAENTVFDVKRLIGHRFDDPIVQKDTRNWPFTLVNDDDNGNNFSKPRVRVQFKHGEQKFTAEELSSMILLKMKHMAEQFIGGGVEINRAVITVPAHFCDGQREAIKEAASIAGLHVLRIINESTAAAVAYCYANKDEVKEERTILIFDIGGGTTNVSILSVEEGIIEVKSSAGETHLGGEDFDNRLLSHCVEEFKKAHKRDLRSNKRAIQMLKKACERAKIELTESHRTCIEIDSLHEGKRVK
jgi:heat shock protein 1/8